LIIFFQLAAEREADLKKQADDKAAAKAATKKKAVSNTLVAYRSGVGKYLNMPSTPGLVLEVKKMYAVV